MVPTASRKRDELEVDAAFADAARAGALAATAVPTRRAKSPHLRTFFLTALRRRAARTHSASSKARVYGDTGEGDLRRCRGGDRDGALGPCPPGSGRTPRRRGGEDGTACVGRTRRGGVRNLLGRAGPGCGPEVAREPMAAGAGAVARAPMAAGGGAVDRAPMAAGGGAILPPDLETGCAAYIAQAMPRKHDDVEGATDRDLRTKRRRIRKITHANDVKTAPICSHAC